MTSCIIVAAGVGARMGLNVNKALIKLGNKRVLMYSIDTFLKYVDEVIVVLNENDSDIIKELPSKVIYTFGGSTRGESVYNGITKAKGDYILIHDAARPFISGDVINEIVNNINHDEAVLTYLESVDTIRYQNNSKLELLDRNKVIKAVTPQCAPKKLILEAYKKSFDENKTFTDDIAVLTNYCDIKVNLVKANPEAFKITYPIDLKLAEVLWRDYD